MFCWLWQRVLRKHRRHFIYSLFPITGNFKGNRKKVRVIGISSVGVCSSNSLATRRDTRNLIYILLLYFLIFLQLLLTLQLHYFSYISINTLFKYSSGFNSQSWTCLGQLTGRVSIVFLIANTATGLLLSGNRLAYAQPQLIITKERRSALTPQTRPPATFLIWQ